MYLQLFYPETCASYCLLLTRLDDTLNLLYSTELSTRALCIISEWYLKDWKFTDSVLEQMQTAKTHSKDLKTSAELKSELEQVRLFFYPSANSGKYNKGLFNESHSLYSMSVCVCVTRKMYFFFCINWFSSWFELLQGVSEKNILKLVKMVKKSSSSMIRIGISHVS